MRPIRARLAYAVCVAMLVTAAATGMEPAAVAASSTERSARLSWPIVPPHRVLRPFEAPPSRYAAGHRGIDIAAVAGTTVSSPAAGEITFAGRVVDRSTLTIDIGGGLLVSIEPVDATMPTHAQVTEANAIGTVARGGHCDGRCIHLGVRLNGEYVSPMLYLGGIERAILLPLADAHD